MPKYFFEGIDIAGASETGSIEAADQQLAYELLQARGIVVFQLTNEEVGTGTKSWLLRDLNLRPTTLSFENQALVAELLSALFDAKLTTTEIAQVASMSSELSEVRRHFDRMGQRIAEGNGFAEAFRSENRSFSPIFVSFLSACEETGSYSSHLKELAEMLEKLAKTQQRVVSALIYPAVLTMAALVLVLIMALYLAPNLEPMFTSMGKTLPPALSFLLDTGTLIREKGALIALVGITLVMLLVPATRHVWAKRLINGLAARLPLIGKVIQFRALSRLAQVCSLFLRAGQPLPKALRASAEIVGAENSFSGHFLEASRKIEEGVDASSVFDQAQNLPPAFRELFRIGETTNKLPVTLTAIAKSMSTKADRLTERALGLLTPALTLFLGLGVGFLIYAIMSAIMEVNELAF